MLLLSLCADTDDLMLLSCSVQQSLMLVVGSASERFSHDDYFHGINDAAEKLPDVLC